MENDSESNKAIEEISDTEERKFSHNFINEPWDDRSDKSKIGIITLLVSIFLATMCFVINNLVAHYSGVDSRYFSSNVEIDCNVVKAEEYPFTARIHSASTNELICVGAVVSPTSVLANEICLKSGPIWLRLGSLVNPKCKKGFNIDVVEPIPHDGVITKALVLLTSFGGMNKCASPIKIGMKLNKRLQVYIIGRPYRGGRTLSFQLAKTNMQSKNGTSTDNIIFRNLIDVNKTICVETIGKCPVRAGDLLVQSERLFGLASTSIHRREKVKTACFANLNVVFQELKALDVDV